MFSAFSCMKKYPPSPKKATAQTVASNNIIAYGIFRFHEGMSICRFHELSHAHATYLINKGASVKGVQQRLGHDSYVTTVKKYVDDTTEMAKDTIKVFEQARREG